MKVLRRILNATPIGKVISVVVATVIVTTLFAMTPTMNLSSGSLAEIKTDPYIYVQNGTGSELLLDSDDNFYMLFVVDGDIYFRKYNYNHSLAVPNTLLFIGGDNAHIDAALDGLGYIHLCWSTTTFGGRSVMYMKLDSDGNVVVDAIKLSATNSYIDQQSRIATNSLGQAYVIWSYYQGTDPSWPTAVDVLYAKIDSDGTIIFTQYYVAPPEWATGFNPNLLVDHDDNLHITYHRGDRIPEVGYDNTYLYYKKFASDGTTVLVGDTKFADTHFVYWAATIDMTLDSANRINLVYSQGIRMPADGGAVETWFMKIDLNGIVLVEPKLVSIDDGYHSTVSYLATDDYDNNYIFWSDGKDGNYEIYYAALDTDGAPIVNQTRLTNTSEFSSTYYMAAVFDSGRNCYWSYWQVDDGTYVIYPVNQTPIANAGPDQIINEGEQAIFNVSGSHDPDGYLVRYEFDFGDGTNYTWEPSLTGIGGKDILVYVTQAHGAYNRTWFDYDLPKVLAEEGFNVNVTGLDQIDKITSGLLFNYDQLWIFSTNFSSAGVFSSSEINTILNFHDNGGGLLIMADHTYGSASTATDANQISTNYGVTFSGYINHGHKEIDPFIVDHPLNENVDTIWGHWSEADLTVTNPDVEVIAIHNGYEMIAVYDVEDEGRIVFDTSVTRMEDGGDPNGHDILKGDNVQYAKNIAKWLGKGFAPEPPPLINHTYGDDGLGIDGIYTMTLTVTDNENATATDTCIVTVNNVAPTIDPFGPFVVDEGSPIKITTTAHDPGSDDLIYTWDFEYGSTIVSSHYNDGISSDSYPSPHGTFPFSATDIVEQTYGDNGIYSVNLTVEDDDGGKTFHTTNITVKNVAPTVDALPNASIDESGTVSFSGHATDPGSDDLTFTWSWEYAPWGDKTTIYYHDDLGPDPFPSPAINPRNITEDATCQFGDDGVFIITLTVTDDDNGSTIVMTNVTVNNVAPTVTIESVTMHVEIGLRVAGRKWNDVGMTLYEEGNPIGNVSIERMPGSPNDQMAWIPVTLDMTRTYSAIVTYTPEDPPNIGANPVWIYIKSDNGSMNKIHHTFNVQQSKKRDSDHWNHVEPWEVDLNAHFIGLPFEITSHITDPGSDDETLTFTYGSQVKTVTYLNNPPNPDPFPSPEVQPMDIMVTTTLVYEGPGTVTLVVKDDDNIRLGVGQGSDTIDVI